MEALRLVGALVARLKKGLLIDTLVAPATISADPLGDAHPPSLLFRRIRTCLRHHVRPLHNFLNNFSTTLEHVLFKVVQGQLAM